MRKLSILFLLVISFQVVGQTSNQCNPDNTEDSRMLYYYYENAEYYFGCKDYLNAASYLREAEKVLPHCIDIQESLALCYWNYYQNCSTFDPKHMLDAKKYLELCLNNESILKEDKKQHQKQLDEINGLLDTKLVWKHYDDGQYYGETYENKRWGWGMYFYNDGRRYEGNWIDDKKEDLEGELYNSRNELIFKGAFSNDNKTYNQDSFLENEIKYWKSIENSNDSLAYLQYLKRYGELGLYKDEAYTRIALLKTSGEQAKSINTECCFYSQYSSTNVHFVVRFENNQEKIWSKHIEYDTARSNLALSRNFYEDQTVVAMSLALYEKVKECSITGKITDNNMKALPRVHITATHTPSGSQYYAWTDTIGNYYLSIPPGGPYRIEYTMTYGRYHGRSKTVVKKDITATMGETKIINAVLDKESIGKVVVEADNILHHKNAWTTDEEYQYNPMKSTSARDVYFNRCELHEIDREDYYDKYGNHLHSTNHRHHTFYVYSDDLCNDEYYKKNHVITSSNNIIVGVYNVKTIQGYRYIAFSKDKSSLIMWFEVDDNLDGKILEKREYKRVPKEDLLPKAVNYDFLNK